MLEGNSLNWTLREQDNNDSQQVNFHQQQMKGWGRVKGIKQLSQQSSSSSIYVVFFSCKLSVLWTLLSEFSQLPLEAGRRQRLSEMRKQAWQKDNCLEVPCRAEALGLGLGDPTWSPLVPPVSLGWQALGLLVVEEPCRLFWRFSETVHVLILHCIMPGCP